MESQPVHRERIPFANILRGVAVLFVLFGHYVGVFSGIRGEYGGYAALGQRPLHRLFEVHNFIPHINYGPLGVALFFVVSGFVIPFSILSTVGRPNWRIAFLVNRFFRLWPTYVVGLAVTLLSLEIAARRTGSDLSLYSPRNVLGQLTFLRDWIGLPQIGGVIWTLEVEVKFYLLVAIAGASLCAGRRTTFLLFGLATPLISLLHVTFPDKWNPPDNFLFSIKYLTFMLIGTVFNLHIRSMISARRAVTMGTLLFCSFAISSDIELRANYFVALMLFTVCYLLRERIHGGRFLTFFASISYPIYAMHAAFGFIGMRTLIGAGIPPYAALPVQLCATVLLAFLIHVWVESPTHKIGRKLSREIAGRPSTHESPGTRQVSSGQPDPNSIPTGASS